MKVFAAAVVLAAVSGKAGAAELGTADIFVLHGIDGRDLGLDQSLPVDVDVVETPGCDVPGLTFGQGLPDNLPALLGVPAPAAYQVKISLADQANPCGGPVVIDSVVPVLSGQTLTVVAHLNESGQPQATAFNTDVTPVGDKVARVIVQHTAEAPAVDVLIRPGGKPAITAFRNLKNGEQDTQTILATDRRVSIQPRGVNIPIFGPTPLTFEAGKIYSVYAVGKAGSDTFTVLIQTPAVQ